MFSNLLTLKGHKFCKYFDKASSRTDLFYSSWISPGDLTLTKMKESSNSLKFKVIAVDIQIKRYRIAQLTTSSFFLVLVSKNVHHFKNYFQFFLIILLVFYAIVYCLLYLQVN